MRQSFHGTSSAASPSAIETKTHLFGRSGQPDVLQLSKGSSPAHALILGPTDRLRPTRFERVTFAFSVEFFFGLLTRSNTPALESLSDRAYRAAK